MSPGLIRIRGWVFHEGGPLEQALLVVAELPSFRPRLGIVRPDVGAAHPGVAHAATSGFQCDVDLRGSQPGPVRIDLIVRTRAGWQPAAAITVQLVDDQHEQPHGRSHAAFTIVQNESLMLPLWLDYYGRYFEPQDLYVLDHGSTDGSTKAIGDRCRVIEVHRTTSFDHRWLRTTVEAFQRFLLQSYEAVLFTETDEFIIADPNRYTGLDHYITALRRPAARCLGFNVVHVQGEPPLRFDVRPLLGQRRCWQASQWYCKRLIAKIPLRWSEGFHVEYNAPDDPPDPALLLAHLHLIDYERSLERHVATATRNWNAEDRAGGAGSHSRLRSREEFDEWFRSGAENPTPRELIPDHIRRVL